MRIIKHKKTEKKHTHMASTAAPPHSGGRGAGGGGRAGGGPVVDLGPAGEPQAPLPPTTTAAGDRLEGGEEDGPHPGGRPSIFGRLSKAVEKFKHRLPHLARKAQESMDSSTLNSASNNTSLNSTSNNTSRRPRTPTAGEESDSARGAAAAAGPGLGPPALPRCRGDGAHRQPPPPPPPGGGGEESAARHRSQRREHVGHGRSLVQSASIDNEAAARAAAKRAREQAQRERNRRHSNPGGLTLSGLTDTLDEELAKAERSKNKKNSRQQSEASEQATEAAQKQQQQQQQQENKGGERGSDGAKAADASAAADEEDSSSRMDPAAALRLHGDRLTQAEQGEILSYRSVYFLGGALPAKIKRNRHLPNDGFDDEKGDYRVISGDHIAFRYEILKLIGRGSFGRVLKCRDHRAGRSVAVKVIRNKDVFHQQAKIEANILKHLKKHDPDNLYHVIHYIEHFQFRNHVVFTFPLLSLNLHQFAKRHYPSGLDLPLIWALAYQILEALCYLSEQQIIHCDLKPENILLVDERAGPQIQLIDFGSACFVGHTVQQYVQSRFYRAPEVILRRPYELPIDMWSFGALLSELWLGDPLFPGGSEAAQMLLFMEVRGLPPAELVAPSRKATVYFRSPAGQAAPGETPPPLVPRVPSDFLREGHAIGDPLPLDEVLGCEDAGFCDLVGRCLTWDPRRRHTPARALRHRFLQEGLKQYTV